VDRETRIAWLVDHSRRPRHRGKLEDYEEMLDLLGRDITASRPACATLGLGTLKAAVKTVEMNRKLRAAGHTDEEIHELRRAIAAERDPMGLVFGDSPGGGVP